MDYSTHQWEYIEPHMKGKRDWLRFFLQERGLQFEEDCEFSIVAKEADGDEIICAGSIAGRVIKCIAVRKDYEGMGFAAALISQLVSYAARKGNSRLFLFTSPDNCSLFEDLNFHLIAEADGEAILMENSFTGLNNFLKSLGEKQDGKIAGAIVANCNPFTKGHRALIEYASQHCDTLHVFVVMEERSHFPAQDRYMLVKLGTEDLENVYVHQAKDYIISSATFPTYFLKQDSNAARIHARLDLDLFCRHIAPHLGIAKRFVGEEPFCKLTSAYNHEMSIILPARGIEFVSIPRLTNNNIAISASRVRELLAQGNFQEISELVPATTYEYLRRITK